MPSSANSAQKALGLEKLDLVDNVMSSIEEIHKLANLPFLQAAWFKGNPFSYLKDYRKKAFVILNSETLLLDGKPPNDAEIEALKDYRQNTSVTIKVPISTTAISPT